MNIVMFVLVVSSGSNVKHIPSYQADDCEQVSSDGHEKLDANVYHPYIHILINGA